MLTVSFVPRGFLGTAMRAGRLGAVVHSVVCAAGAVFLVAMVVPFLVGAVPAVDRVLGALVTFGTGACLSVVYNDRETEEASEIMD